MPTWPATACAVPSLSPVTIHTSSPSAFSWATASAEVRLDRVGDVEQTRPGGRRGRRTWGVRRARRTGRLAARAATSTPSESIRARLPTDTTRPSTAARDAVARDGGEVGDWRGGGRPRSRAAADDRPRRRGARCRPRRRRPGRAARRRSSRPVVTRRASPGRPRVTVPVLSSTTAVTRRAVSSASPSPIRMPSSAALPVPTMTAVGVASPRAQGQAMIRTATVVPIARTRRSRLRAEGHPGHEGGEGGEQDGGHEPGRDPVGQPLHRGRASPGRPRPGARSGRACCSAPTAVARDDQGAGAVEGGADDGVARLASRPGRSRR